MPARLPSAVLLVPVVLLASALSPVAVLLLPVVLALRQWGEEWGYGNMRQVLADRRDGKPVRKICVQGEDGRELKLQDLTWVERAASDSLRTAAE